MHAIQWSNERGSQHKHAILPVLARWRSCGLAAAVAVAKALVFIAALATAGNAKAAPVHGIAMYGEPALSADYTHLPHANPQAPKGGRFTFGVVGSFDSLNPFVLKSMRTTARGMWDPELGHLIFEPLMIRSYDEPFTLYGRLAEAVEMPEDRSWMEFTLDGRARWHDGQPVIPEDVIFTYELLREKGRPPFSSRMNRIASIEKTGERKVRFTFNELSDREFPLIVAGFTPVLPRHATDPETFGDSTLTPPIGSGPYKVAEVQPGQKIVYARDPGYWGKDLPALAGMHNFDEIAIEYYQQATSLFEAFKKGLVDVYAESEPSRWERAYDFDAVTEGRVIKEEFVSGDPANMTGFIFNTRRKIFADRQVREALARAFDFETLNSNLFFNAYKRTASFWQGSELSAQGRPADDRERALLADFPGVVQPDIMDGSWALPVTSGNGLDRTVLRDVLGRLEAAGITRNGRSLQLPDGSPFAFEIMTRNLNEEKVAISYQNTLARLGIEVSVRTVDDAQFQKRLQTFDYDMVIATYSASLSPGIEQQFRWSQEAATSEGSFNYAGASEPAIDHVIQEMVRSRSREEFVSAVRALDRLLLSGHYMVPLYHLDRKWIARWDHLQHPEKTALYGNRYPVWWSTGATGR